MKKISICLSCINGFLTYDFIESLKNQKDFKVKIIGIDSNDRTKGKIICDKFYKVSRPENEKQYLNDIIKIYKKEKFSIFFPLSDSENYIILKNKLKLEKKKINFKLPFNDFNLSKTFYDKKTFLEQCKKKGIKIGDYKIISDFKSLNLFIKEKKFAKYILKPVKGSGTNNVFLINQKSKKKIKILESRNCFELNLITLKKMKVFKKNKEYIIMPYYKGEIYDVDCIALNGKIKELCIRLREIKNRFMFYSTGHRIVSNGKIKKLISKFVKIFEINGICDFDVIKNGNNYLLLEASCRFSGSVGVCTKSGINFPAQMVRYIMKMKTKKFKKSYNTSFRSFLVFQKIDNSKRKILLNDYIPHYSKQLTY